MNEGNLHEADMLRRLDSHWEILGEAQREIEFLVRPGVVIRGHIDEMAKRRMSEDRLLRSIPPVHVVECKSMSENKFRDYQARGLMAAFYPYAVQLSVYMIALNMPGLLVYKNRNTGQMRWDIFEEPPVSFQDICSIVDRSEKLAEQGQLPACDDGETYFCKFNYLHEKFNNPSPEDEPFQVTSEFEQLLYDYYMAKKEEDMLRWRKDKLRERVLEAVGDHREIESAEFKVSRRVMATKRMDTKYIRKHLTKEQLTEAYIVGESDYLIVDPKKEGK